MWNYAEMTKEAKKHGGPEKYLSDYGEEMYKEGELNGEKKGEFKGIAEGSIATIFLGGFILGIYSKIRQYREKKKSEKIAECKEKANIAAKKYIDEINKYNTEQTDTNDIEQTEIE